MRCESVVVSFSSSLVVFFRVPSLHALFSFKKRFCDLFLIAATHNIAPSPCTSTCTHSTTYHIAFHNSLHTTNKHKAYLCKQQQNGTRCRDGVKVDGSILNILLLFIKLPKFQFRVPQLFSCFNLTTEFTFQVFRF